MVVTLLPVFVAAALIVAALTPVVRSAARRVPLARLGGAGIGVAWIAVLAAVYAAGPDALRLPLRQVPLPEIVAAGFVVFALGVRDDLRAVSPARKILVQALAATLVAGSGIRIDHVTVSGTTWTLGPLAITATVLWIVALTAAFDELDHLDALAPWLAIAGGATCTAIVVVRGDTATAVMLAALVGALAGFLPYTRASGLPLGSSGSLLTGFVLSVTAITGLQKSATALAVGGLILIFALPIDDILTMFVRRHADRERKRRAHRT